MWLQHMNMGEEEQKVGRRNYQRGQITWALVGQGEEFGHRRVIVKQGSCIIKKQNKTITTQWQHCLENRL